MRNLLFISILILICTFIIGYILGAKSVKITEKTTVSYKTMPTISVAITPKPVSTSIPAVPKYLWRTDTLTMTQVVDTAAILTDWILQREYAGRLIADSTGTVDYLATVQYNQLQHIGIDYTPVQRTVTTTKKIERRFTPFVLIGGNTAGFGQIEAGALFGTMGVSVEAGTNFDGNNYIGGKIGVKLFR